MVESDEDEPCNGTSHGDALEVALSLTDATERAAGRAVGRSVPRGWANEAAAQPSSSSRIEASESLRILFEVRNSFNTPEEA
jgi:hypothetical protein